MTTNKAGAKKTYRKTALLRNELLDAAEQLFAEKGYQETSIRDITDLLGVRLAAVNYHFDSKQNLLQEMIRLRAEPLNEARWNRLEQVTINPDTPDQTVDALIRAMFEPLLEFYLSGDQGWRSYCIYIAKLTTAGGEFAQIASSEYDQVVKVFIHKLRETLPEYSDYQIHCAFQFILGAITLVISDNKRLDSVSDGRFHSSDVALISEHYFKFATAGILGIANQ